MALFKCKMCGGALEINNNETVATCEYCGTQQTLPKLDDDRRANLYDRANHFRRNNEFDKAMGIYENILNEDNTDAEAYWSLVLCRYGIEYVEDPASRRRIPTVNRAQFTSIFDDDNYKSALQYADGYQRSIYEEEAKAINEIQKGILAISQKEEPFDVFICYKETGHNGRRTPDSVLANDLYHQLTQEGFKVFFARITLEDKLGVAYEPYIFAALNSAKVMVALGTKPEYFSAVWVKNEWSRYLALIKNGAKKILIPAYKDMDPYDLPEEFSHLQAQDMSKLGFMQDLIRGIKKIAQAEEPKAPAVKETVVSAPTANSNISPLLKRAFMFLEDGDWNSANEYCEKVLDMDPENPQAYLGKLMAELRIRKQEGLQDNALPFDGSNNYQKAMRFGDAQLKADLVGYIEHITTRNENARLEGIYTRTQKAMSAATTESAYKEAARLFETIREYRDSIAQAKVCYEKAEAARERAEATRKDMIYEGAKKRMNSKLMIGDQISCYQVAIKQFESIPGWKDADEQILVCQKKIEEIRAQEEADRLEQQRKAERIAKRNKKIAIIAAAAVCVIVAVIILLNTVIIPNGKYNEAVALMEAGNYTEAIDAFEAMNGYRDSNEKILECQTAIKDQEYTAAATLIQDGKFQEAINAFQAMNGYKDSNTKIEECTKLINEQKYIAAVALMESEQYENAITAFQTISDYKDSETKILDCKYAVANSLMEAGEYRDACAAFEVLQDYKDASQKLTECRYLIAKQLDTAGEYGEAALAYAVVMDYSDARACAFAAWDKIAVRDTISADWGHTVALKTDGTVVATKFRTNGFIKYDGQCEVSDWKNIIAVSAGSDYTIGLKADGTVVAVGDNGYGGYNVSNWTDIVAISAGDFHTVGLKADGTVVAVGYNIDGQCNVSDWTDIIAISAGGQHTVGLKADGTVVAVGGNANGQCNVSGWRDIVAISAGGRHTVGLKADGTAVATEFVESDRIIEYNKNQCNVSGWRDIVAISAGESHTVGLKADGTVVAVGENDNGQRNVSGWRDIVAISAGDYHTVGLKADGTLVSTKYEDDYNYRYYKGQCDVGGWYNIKAPEK